MTDTLVQQHKPTIAKKKPNRSAKIPTMQITEEQAVTPVRGGLQQYPPISKKPSRSAKIPTIQITEEELTTVRGGLQEYNPTVTKKTSRSSAKIPTMQITEERVPKKTIRGEKLRGFDKVAKIPIKVIPTVEAKRKPDWIRVKLSSPAEVARIKATLRTQKLHTVCEEAACPNLAQCFGGGTATFMIMGAICTRRCPFCDVGYGKPYKLDKDEPLHTAETIQGLKLKYAVITSVDRDDLRDGGAAHFAEVITRSKELNPDCLVEILVPDFKGRLDVALDILVETPPDVFNHNIETVPRLYEALRPGSEYQNSLDLLKAFKSRRPDLPTKCGLMVGLGETEEEIYALLDDLRANDVDLVTIGQYLQPSKDHAPIDRYVHPDEFQRYMDYGKKIGFFNIWAGPMVRSSYFADRQYYGEDCPKPVRSKKALQAEGKLGC